METTAKPTAAEVAQLRAEMRRRKILERGDERIRKLFGESKDEEVNSLEERNKNLIEEIKKDPVVFEKINSIDKQDNQDNQENPDNQNKKQDKLDKDESTSTDKFDELFKAVKQNLDNNQNNTLINQTLKFCVGKMNEKLDNFAASSKLNSDQPNVPESNNLKSLDQSNSSAPNKPLIDLSYFEKLEKKERLKKERLELTKLQVLVIHLVNILTIKRDLILMNIFKILFACLASYFSFNIVTPFVLSQSICLFYFNLNNEKFSNHFGLKLSYNFIKTNLIDSFTFFFFYTIIQVI